jgi:adenylate kinase family enzyme
MRAPLRRVLVIGPPGVGKSWVAARLASTCKIPHVELDSLKLKPQRQIADSSEYESGVRQIVQADSWLLDGNWSDDALADDVWSAAGFVVWLDFPRHVVMWQIARRSVRRVIFREDYYGWKETVRGWFSPTHPFRWSWRMVRGYSERYSEMVNRLAVDKHVRLRSRSDAAEFVASLYPVGKVTDVDELHRVVWLTGARTDHQR